MSDFSSISCLCTKSRGNMMRTPFSKQRCRTCICYTATHNGRSIGSRGCQKCLRVRIPGDQDLVLVDVINGHGQQDSPPRLSARANRQHLRWPLEGSQLGCLARPSWTWCDRHQTLSGGGRVLLESRVAKIETFPVFDYK